jgi:peroxiredoxin
MKRLPVLFAALAVLAAGSVQAAAVVGEKAPDFTLTDVKGAKHTLSSLKGKHVVLEWVNYDCPFVQKHYGSGNMQKLQKMASGKGVVWLAVNSSADGKQGNFTPAVVESRSKEHGAAFSAYLLDPDGKVGKAYGAKTTPHMYLIDPQGTLVYAGGIDDKPSTDVEDIKSAKNYVQAALDESLAGKKISTSTSKPYGCSIKYAE